MSQARSQPSVSLFYNPQLRGLFWQVVLILIVGFLAYEAVVNAATNMRARGIPTDFAFWDRVASFDINQTLVSYSATSTYGRAFLVGLLNSCEIVQFLCRDHAQHAALVAIALHL